MSGVKVGYAMGVLVAKVYACNPVTPTAPAEQVAVTAE